ncbi:MAG: phosphatidylglycerophosphatase A [Pirellulales bacterium]
METDRAAARLAVLAPGGRTRVFRDAAAEVSLLDAFAVIAGSEPERPEDFVSVTRKTHRQASTLGNVIHDFWMGLPLPAALKTKSVAFCRATGISSIVGSRTTWVAVSGEQEYYFVRAGTAPSGAAGGDRFWDLAMSSGGLGHLPLVGATAASAAVCVIGAALSPILPDTIWRGVMAVVALVSSALCVAGEKRAQRLYLAEDPREVVLDEVAGMAVALALSGSGWWAMAAAFFAFRFFDIFKIGVHWVEERGWPGGIVWDDLLAGVYAGALVVAVLRVAGA